LDSDFHIYDDPDLGPFFGSSARPTLRLFCKVYGAKSAQVGQGWQGKYHLVGNWGWSWRFFSRKFKMTEGGWAAWAFNSHSQLEAEYIHNICKLVFLFDMLRCARFNFRWIRWHKSANFKYTPYTGALIQ
jgi:hypothetical protein